MTVRPVTTEGKLLARIADSLDELVGILRPEPPAPESTGPEPQPEVTDEQPEPKQATAKKTAQRSGRRKVDGT